MENNFNPNKDKETKKVLLENNRFFKELYRITPLSKYFALTLFIILPFLGGWIGYQNAPAEIVYLEKVVEIENSESKSYWQVYNSKDVLATCANEFEASGYITDDGVNIFLDDSIIASSSDFRLIGHLAGSPLVSRAVYEIEGKIFSGCDQKEMISVDSESVEIIGAWWLKEKAAVYRMDAFGDLYLQSGVDPNDCVEENHAACSETGQVPG